MIAMLIPMMAMLMAVRKKMVVVMMMMMILMMVMMMMLVLMAMITANGMYVLWQGARYLGATAINGCGGCPVLSSSSALPD